MTKRIETLADLETTTRLALTVAETARLIGVDRRTLTASTEAGEVPSAKVGRQRLIPITWIKDLLLSA